jgi:signal transduction histidine kinase
MKIKTKITLLFFAISTIGLGLMNAAIFYFVSEFNFEDFFKRLEARVNFAASIRIHPDEKTQAYQEVRNRYLQRLADERDHVAKVGPNNTFKRPVKVPESFYNAILSGQMARYSVHNRFYAGALFKTPYGNYVVIAEAIDPYGFKELHELRRILIVLFFVSVILAYVAGHVFSYYTITPLRSIIKKVQSISATNLHQRLDDPKGGDEIAELALTFNNMLTRLETSFETQNNFVSNASHELRTPLAIITGETELLLARDNLNAQTTANVKTILQEAEKLENILESLLGLAQTGFDGKKQNWQIIRVDELVLAVAESVKKIDEQRVIDIDFSMLPDDERELCTEGNANLLRLAMSNIVMNAFKYSNNQPVSIRIASAQKRIIVTVIDRGIGIPNKEQPYIFEPFFRASNTTNFEGYGIGLPLTLNIIRLHNGSIDIISEENRGTEIKLQLPVARKV